MTLGRTLEWRLAAREKPVKAVIQEEMVRVENSQSMKKNEQETNAKKHPSQENLRQTVAEVFSEARVLIPCKSHISVMSPHVHNNHALPL